MSTDEPIELGLTREELADIFNEAAQTQSPERQAEIKARAAEYDKLFYFGEGTPADLVLMVQFVVNAIRLNNKRIQEQLRSGEAK